MPRQTSFADICPSFQLHDTEINPGMAELPDQVAQHWIMKDILLASSIRPVMADQRKLLLSAGIARCDQVCDDELAICLLEDMGFASAAKPHGSKAYLKFVFRLFVACLKQGEYISAQTWLHKRQNARDRQARLG